MPEAGYSAGEELIDVQQLIAESSVEELIKTADDYFARITDYSDLLTKPFRYVDECPQLLINLAVVLQGLALLPGMTILEFGAGTCWASRYLTQLGLSVISLDASPTALQMGQELYRRQPIIGDRPTPRFLAFDGRHIDLPDASVDRIMCLDAFHHVPNPGHVLAEMARILKTGGIAGFAEPGPNHSKSPQSQQDMRAFDVVENDVDIHRIWSDAQRSGFTSIKLAAFYQPPFLVNLEEFDDLLRSGAAAERFTQSTVSFLQEKRNFFLYKNEEPRDSRYRAGLTAQIRISPPAVTVKQGETITVRATVTNTSPAVWLPGSVTVGGVSLGCHVYHSNGELYRHSYHWEALKPGQDRPIVPGETVVVDVSIPPLPQGRYLLEFDMVSNEVCWFHLNGSPVARVPIEIR